MPGRKLVCMPFSRLQPCCGVPAENAIRTNALEISDVYGMQLFEDLPLRQEWAKKVGLGFDLPMNEPSLVGLRGLKTAEGLKQTEDA
jgi:hypothetical protein